MSTPAIHTSTDTTLISAAPRAQYLRSTGSADERSVLHVHPGPHLLRRWIDGAETPSRLGIPPPLSRRSWLRLSARRTDLYLLRMIMFRLGAEQRMLAQTVSVSGYPGPKTRSR